MIEGIILAGGYSSRFKQNKMVVNFKGQALILHTAQTLLKICDHVYVVTGHYHEEIKILFKDYSNITIVNNKDYQEGMFSSVKCGASHVKHDFFIIPGDYPLVSDTTYKTLLKGKKTIRVPSYKHKLGHPLFISYSLKDDLVDTDVESLKDFRNLHDYEIIEVEDQFINFDIDTIEDLEEIEGKE